MNLQEIMLEKAKAAKQAAGAMAILSTETKNRALMEMADVLEQHSPTIIEANRLDVELAEHKGIRRSYIDRLLLNESRIAGMADGLRQAAGLPDPVGEGDYATVRPNGLEIRRVRVPLGTVGIIYEARPNVTSDAAGLCIKAGNSVILKGGSEAINSNKAIIALLQEAAYAAGIPDGAIQFVDVTDREAVQLMLKMNEYLDVIIPRGGAGLIKTVVNNSSVPVIETGTGVCHTFVDESADMQMALDIAVNAKTSRPSVCNAMETLLVHQNIAEGFLPELKRVMAEQHCELRGCLRCQEILSDITPATEEDWHTEYGDLILSVKIVDDVNEAIDHINKYNTGHSEAIVTESLKNARQFQQRVDAAAVYVNASTRFTDGCEFGFGAEIGISTQKLHARGPMGLAALTSTKYLINGDGQIR
ncbi:glutamate-5-semialdehyde dehydrogenase [uncultured Anaerovibrio sp.]|uniref:glutamate-5-semialdehyde dehydrogenase n=1 Tax=uncultured Anaerovibrio sp. TaxID=361586 RepID=UPI0026159557|nr:glutamate-5-semialdehyde dehydrogenase [uncultured Anaerovibrio sp.]